MDPYLGRKLENRYEILERIGSGGMSIVYKAKDNRLNRLVAVKILRSDLEQDEDFRRRFNAESQAVAQLSSPHIVSIYDVSKGGDAEYIVMELIDGITLKQYMEKRGKLNWREALHFITQIMRGLAHAHSKGIVHRDIKPQNIMVLRDGSVKVADFGIAVLENAAQTLTQQALGSVHYISPEQARGERTDARSDLYSAGIVLYEMLTGKLPFEGDSAVSVALQHLSATPPAPGELNPEIPAQLELICMKAMTPDLDRRYQSAEEMIRDLEAFRKDPAIRLDFRMEDLRPPVSDEPTRFLRTASDAASAANPDGGEERDQASSYGRVTAVLLAVAGILGVILAVILFRAVSGTFGHEEAPESYVVRSLVGYTIPQAEDLDGVRGIFEIIEEGTLFSDEYPEGVIIRQNPSANNYRKGNNLVIRVWVSSGMDTAEMPDVTGQTVTEAELRTLRDLIQHYNLKLEIPDEDRQYSDDFTAGQIISSVPKAGETLRKGDTIRLSVSRGPRMVVLISFKNMTLEDANKRLKDMNLISGSPKFIYSDEPFGVVLAQDPAVNTEVRERAEVIFTVSRGPEPVAPEQKREVRIPLPDDRETAYLEVWQDGERVWSGPVDCTEGSKSLELTASGESVLEIYLDRVEIFNGSVVIENSDSALVPEVDFNARNGRDGETEADEHRDTDENTGEIGDRTVPESGGGATAPETGEGMETGGESGEITGGGIPDSGDSAGNETQNHTGNDSMGNTGNTGNDSESGAEHEDMDGDERPDSWIGTDIIAEE